MNRKILITEILYIYSTIKANLGQTVLCNAAHQKGDLKVVGFKNKRKQ